MNKSGWKWTLACSILFALLTGMALISYNYEMFRKWPLYLVLAAVFAGITYFLYRSGQEIAAAEQVRAKEAAEAAVRESREKEARRKADAYRFRHESFAVAGVTFKNEDGTDRQKILREIALNDFGICDAWLSREEEGEDPPISVETDLGQVGFVRRSEKAQAAKFIGKRINSSVLHVERFQNEDGDKIYRADLQIGMDRSDPEQAWYFNGLQE